jgi:hypothetical protein
VVTRSREQLLELFDEQIDYLESSNKLFDGGKIAEAKRLAVPLRVLFHHTSRSHALLNQLGLNETLTWVDSAGRPDPNNLLPEWGLVQSGINIEDGKATPLFRAPLGDRPPKMIRTGSLRLSRGSRIPFEEWWTEHVVKDADGPLFSRKDFVLALANKEGGAHVDPEILQSYNKIANLNSMGWTYSEGPEGRALTGPPIPVGPSAQAGSSEPVSPSTPPRPREGWTDPIALDNPVPYAVRQISYEVVESVRQQRDRFK